MKTSPTFEDPGYGHTPTFSQLGILAGLDCRLDEDTDNE